MAFGKNKAWSLLRITPGQIGPMQSLRKYFFGKVNQLFPGLRTPTLKRSLHRTGHPPAGNTVKSPLSESTRVGGGDRLFFLLFLIFQIQCIKIFSF